jgi:formylglycine-generating enzyme required for sulfatase activity
MAETDEPGRPKPSAPGYLPRLWKAAPEGEFELEEPLVNSRKKGREEAESDPKDPEPQPRPRKKKKVEPELDDGTGATKLEETPVLDTYEARQKARWIIGGIVAGVGLIGLIIVLRAFRGGEEDHPTEIVEHKPVNEGRANPEVEARNIVETARQADKVGNSKAAVALLEKVAKNYPATVAAREAMHATDRYRRNLPLFGADIPEQASGPKPPPPAKVTTAPPPAGTLPNGPPGPTAPMPPNPSDTQSPQIIVAQAPPAIPVKPLPSGFREKPGTAIHATGWPMQIVSEHDGGVMVLVPAGTFLMGREDGEPAEGPPHRVYVSTYYIDQHEVTVRQFVQFLKETGRPLDAAKLLPRETTDPPATEDFPAVNVSAQQARAYCSWAHKRLPTEAQWEFAARSSDGRISYWNGELPRKDPAKGSRTVAAVMSLPSDVSPCGAYDMAANAWEWTSEFWDSQYYQQLRNTAIDPTGPKQSRVKPVHMTVKGGSRVGILTWREGQKSETRLPFLGFRGALPVEGAPVAAPTPSNPNTAPGLSGGVVPF